MAENAETKDTLLEDEVKDEVKDEAKKEEKKDEGKEEPNVQDLLNRIAKLERNYNKACAEASDYKKKWRESLSETEKASMEKAEEEAKRAEELDNLKRENQIFHLKEMYLAEEGFNLELATKASIAEVDNDREALHQIRKQVAEEREKKLKEDITKELMTNYNLNAGQGGGDNSITKEQFEAMSLIERSKLKRENEAEYNRLMKL